MSSLAAIGDSHPQQPSAPQRQSGVEAESSGEFTFGDFLDIINPLQHIPVVSTLYREITGDEISPHARIIGDTLFGGPAGFLSSIANVFYEEVAGEDIGETALAFFTGEDDTGEPQFAEGDPATGGAPLAVSSSGQPAPGVALPAENAAPPGMLTGQAALNALFHDLRQTQARPLPQHEAEAKRSDPLAPGPAADAAASEGPEAPVHPLILAQDAPKADIAERMMEALDKYRTMSREGRVPSAADKAEEDNEVAWHADPDPDAPWQFDPATPAGQL